MASDAPPFWWEKPDWRAYALSPLSLLYAVGARWTMRRARRQKIDLPVLCVGNFVVGGAGKTPIAITLAKQAKRMKLSPGFLSRGFGGGSAHAHLVDATHDSARHVGDEALLLGEHAPVAVTPDRAAGAKLLIERGCDFLIMDDGFQSARLHMDYALLVVDGRFGIGNGHVIPAGPLRASLTDQMRLATAIVKVGGEAAGETVVRQASRAGRPVFEAFARPKAPERFAGRRFYAFAGIGHPEKFFDTVTEAGGSVEMSRGFPDHHFYSHEEMQDMAVAAAEAGLELITTAKDAARLRHGAAPADFVDKLSVLEIDAVFENAATAKRIISETLEAWRHRRLTS